MAPVLQCPECGTKHPLDAVGFRSAFPCGGCGRTLKVPEQARSIVGSPNVGTWPPPPAPDAAPLAPPPPDPHATQAIPTAPPLERAAVAAPPVPPPPLSPTGGVPVARPTPASDRADDLVPGRWVRFGLWVVAVPLAFIVVFALARAFGVLSSSDVQDVALADGWHRFVPIARLLPFVALAIALFVQGGVFGIMKLRERRTSTAANPQPAGPRSSRQSSRTRA